MAHVRRARSLRIFLSIVSLTIGSVFATSWIRNLRAADIFWAPLPANRQIAIVSSDGQLECGISKRPQSFARRTNEQPHHWGWQTYTASQTPTRKILVPWKTVIHYRFGRNGDMTITLPHWLLVLVTILAAGVPWIRWSNRFALRTMLAAMTVVAFICALIASAGE
jgi:hypothetical protein